MYHLSGTDSNLMNTEKLLSRYNFSFRLKKILQLVPLKLITYLNLKKLIVDSSCKKTSCHLQQHFFNIFESNKGTKGPENHSLD
jgi:hypothetical protein